MTDAHDGTQSSPGWRAGLTQAVDELGRFIEGRFVAGIDATVEAVPAERFFDAGYFQQVVARAAGVDPATISFDADHPSSNKIEVHAQVSRIVRHYAGSLSIAALVGLAEGIGLDVSPANCTMIMWRDVPFRMTLDLSDADVIRCSERPTSWRGDGRVVDSVAELRSEVWQSLYAAHIAPFVDFVAGVTKISPALLWTNVAEWVGVISDAADEYLDESAAAPYLEDRHAILAADHLPGLTDEVNPLRDRLDWISLERDAFPYEYCVRRLCCLTYLLADRSGRLCGGCPYLPVDEGVALLLEQHGVPVGAPGGPAQQQAIERGRQRPSMRRVLQNKERAERG